MCGKLVSLPLPPDWALAGSLRQAHQLADITMLLRFNADDRAVRLRAPDAHARAARRRLVVRDHQPGVRVRGYERAYVRARELRRRVNVRARAYVRARVHAHA